MLDEQDRLVCVNKSGGALAPRFFIGQTVVGNRWWFRNDVSEDLVDALEELSREEPLVADLTRPSLKADRYERVLADSSAVENVSSGPAYCFPETLDVVSTAELIQKERRDVLSRYCSEWVEDVSECQPFSVLMRDGQAVSLCATVRRTEEAEQAGVETHPDFRGEGCASEVVAAWGAAVRQLGRIPLYSTSWTNKASQAVAAKLGLIQFASDLHVR